MSFGMKMAALAGLAALAWSGAVSAQAPAAPDKKPAEYTSVVQDITVDKPIDVVMKKTAGYCDIAGRKAMFGNVLKTMKAAAEAP